MQPTARSERVEDYHAIAEVVAAAFARPGRAGTGEMLLVDVLRHSEGFDPELALVGEVDGVVAAYALWNPHTVFIGGEPTKGAMLAPLGVHPDHQRKGVGRALMQEGHRRLIDKGYSFAFHMGVTSYYPQHGYDSHMFGKVCASVPWQDIPPEGEALETRQVQPEDIPAVVAMWREWFLDTPFAIFPGDGYLDWVRHFEHIRSEVFHRDGAVVGFLRYDVLRPQRVTCYLAADAEAATAMMAHVARQISDESVTHLELPIHPGAAAARRLLVVPWSPIAETGPYGFLRVFAEDGPAAAYRDGVRAGTIAPGIHTYPPAFDFD